MAMAKKWLAVIAREVSFSKTLFQAPTRSHLSLKPEFVAQELGSRVHCKYEDSACFFEQI